jgi:hypothetical protein
MHLIVSVCPTHSNGGAGHDDNLPLTTLRAFVNLVLKVSDKVERKGKKGRVERYVCGALVEIGVRKAMMKRQISWILSRRAGFPFYGQSELPKI